jgi:hypothetical protein
MTTTRTTDPAAPNVSGGRHHEGMEDREPGTGGPASTGNPAVLRHRWKDGLEIYRAGRVSDGLVTARQLRALGLSRAGLSPAGWLHYCAYHYLCPLYDAAAARFVWPLTERQWQELAEGRKLANTVLCKRCGQVRVPVWESRLCATCEPLAEAKWYAEQERRQRAADEALARRVAADRSSAAGWAAAFLADPSHATADTETTGLHDAWIVEIAIVDVTGQVLLDTLVNPGVPIPADAAAIHGITDEMVSKAPVFADILPDLTRILHGRPCAIWNEDFDVGILRGELDRYYRAAEPDSAPDPWLTHPSAEAWLEGLRTECAMTWYAQWYGEWHDYWGNYTWKALHGGHRARGDCEAAIERLKTMAADAAAEAPYETHLGLPSGLCPPGITVQEGDVDAGGAARIVTVHHMTMGGQPYWAAADVAVFLDSAADHWTAVGDDDDPVPRQVAQRLRQLSVHLAAEAIQQHDWWASHRPGRSAPPAPASSLPEGAKIRTAIKYKQVESHLYLNAMDVAAFPHAAADSSLRDHERLFDRESAGRIAARYLHATAEDLGLEAMLVTRAPSGEPMS